MRSQPLFSNDRTYGNSTLTLHQYKKNPECQFYIFIQFHSECCLPSVTGPVGTITWQGRINGAGGGYVLTQFLADQLTLNQVGRLCPPHYYVPPKFSDF